jgi:hypothetical protein
MHGVTQPLPFQFGEYWYSTETLPFPVKFGIESISTAMKHYLCLCSVWRESLQRCNIAFDCSVWREPLQRCNIAFPYSV